MKVSKKIIALLVALTFVITPVAASADTEDTGINNNTVTVIPNNPTVSTPSDLPDEPENPEDDGFVDILLIGNSLLYYNKMDTDMFPAMCEAAGKKVRVSSITEGGTTLYRVASEKTSIGKQVLKALTENTYDYVVIEPSRRITPFEYSVYHAEKEAALKLNGLINAMGAETIVLAEPGLEVGDIDVYTMNADGINSTTTYTLPMDRATHAKYVENLCYDYVSDMENAEVVKIGEAAEVLLKHFPDFNSLYRADNRHPSVRGSYLEAACIYSAIFDESFVGVNYVSSLYPQNAVTAQRAAAVAVLGADEEILDSEQGSRKITAALSSNSVATISWNESKTATYYEIYRKNGSGSYVYLGKTQSNQCTYANKSLSAGKTYNYKIKSYHKEGDITFSFGFSNEVSVETLAKPTKPNATLVNKKTTKLTFKAVSGAEYYNIYRKQAGTSSFVLIGSTSKTEYTDKTMKAGNYYTYKIAAVKQSGKAVSTKSAGRKILAIASPKVKLSTSGWGKVTVNITSVKGASHYAIYAKAKGEKTYKLLKTTKKLKYTAKNLSSGKTYYFKVKAYDTKNTSTTSSLYRTKKITVN